MIVRKQDDGSMILITQSDHALLSGFFAAHWGNADFAPPQRRESAARAAALHDCGWRRYEAAPRYDAASKTSPNFFEVPNDDAQLAAFGAGIDWLTGIDPYAGLLISRHRTGLWRGRYGAVKGPLMPARGPPDPRVEAFAAAYEARQETALAQLDRAVFRIDYQMLQFWDLLSLTLCVDESKPRILEFVPDTYAGDGANGAVMRIEPRGDGEIGLDPWPFARRPLEFGITFRHLPASDYRDNEAFRLAYFGARVQARKLMFV